MAQEVERAVDQEQAALVRRRGAEAGGLCGDVGRRQDDVPQLAGLAGGKVGVVGLTTSVGASTSRHSALTSRMRSSETTETETMQGRPTPSCASTASMQEATSSSPSGKSRPSSFAMS